MNLRSFAIFAVMVALGLLASSGNGSAQREAPAPAPKQDEALVPAPTFNNATVIEILTWGSRNAGITWLGRGEQFLDESGKPLTVSASGGKLLTLQDRQIHLYELLRKVGLVPLPVAGMPAGTVTVVPASEAAGIGAVATDFEELDGAWFATLALEAWAIPVKELDELVRKFASPHAVISTLEATGRVLVADFIDNLGAIWDAHIHAQTPAAADGDVIIETILSSRHDSLALATALQRSVHSTQSAKVSRHDTSGAIILTGPRIEVEALLDTFDTLEELPVLPGSTRKVSLFTAKILSADVLAQSARGAFAAEVALGSIRIGEILSRRLVMVEATEGDWRKVEAWLNAADVPARSVAEAETDEAWRALREAERREAERRAAESGETAPSAPTPGTGG